MDTAILFRIEELKKKSTQRVQGRLSTVHHYNFKFQKESVAHCTLIRIELIGSKKEVALYVSIPPSMNKYPAALILYSST